MFYRRIPGKSKLVTNGFAAGEADKPLPKHVQKNPKDGMQDEMRSLRSNKGEKSDKTEIDLKKTGEIRHGEGRSFRRSLMFRLHSKSPVVKEEALSQLRAMRSKRRLISNKNHSYKQRNGRMSPVKKLNNKPLITKGNTEKMQMASQMDATKKKQVGHNQKEARNKKTESTKERLIEVLKEIKDRRKTEKAE